MSSRQPNILQISPADLYFPPPLNRVIACILRLNNPTTSDIVAFKVKTTAPKRYCVRPNNGIVEPGQTVEVQILLQAMQEQPADLKCKDKFLVQSIVVTADQAADTSAVWSSGSAPTMEHKLRCHFQSPSGEVVTPAKSSTPAANTTVGTPDPSGPGTPRATSTPSEPKTSATPSSTAKPVASSSPAPAATSSGTSGSDAGNASDKAKIKKLEATMLDLTSDRERLRASLEAAANRIEQVQKTASSSSGGKSGFSLQTLLIVSFLVLIIGVLLGATGGGSSSSILK